MLSPMGLSRACQGSGPFSLLVRRVNIAPAMTITAYLFDDHEIVGRGLRELLKCIDDLPSRR